jgi:hypothetical protein
MKHDTNRRTKLLALVWMAIAIASRILPHPPNMSPALGVSLFAGRELGWKTGTAVSLLMFALSDILLSSLNGHAPFGWWSLFTYSGLIAVVAVGRFWGGKFSAPRAVGLTLSSSIAFWLWTNFGTWLTSGMYSPDLAGLITCFGLALPFLGLAIVGDLSFMLLIFLSFDYAKQNYFFKEPLSA